MAAGAKFLVLGTSLVGVLCGGYIVYKNISGFSSEVSAAFEQEGDSDQASNSEESSEPDSNVAGKWGETGTSQKASGASQPAESEST